MATFQLVSDSLVKAIKKSILTDSELEDCLEHFEELMFCLEEHQKIVGSLYDLVLQDVIKQYDVFRGMKTARVQDKDWQPGRK